MAAETILSKIEAELKAKKTRGYEVYMQVPTVTQLYIRRSEIELLNVVEHVGYGIRILDKGFGSANSNRMGDSQIKECIKNALFIAANSKPEEKFSFPTKKKTEHVDIVDEDIKGNAEETVREFAEQLINIADAEKVELPFAKVKAYYIRTFIVNSEGLDAEKEETMLFTEISFKTSKGENLSEYWSTKYARRPGDIKNEELRNWARLSKENLKAKMPKTEKLEVIFSPAMLCDLLVPVVGAHCTGRALKLGISKFEEGEKVASNLLTIYDDGLYPYGLQSSPFDDEGNPQRKIRIIENGEFQNRLYDQYYGLEYGKESTGNGIRQSLVQFFIDEKFSIPPNNQTTNLRVEAGKKTLDELISEVSHGLLIYNFSWLNPDQASGFFGAEIRNASWIENGEIAEPVKGGLVSGSVFDLIKNISGISDRAEIVSGQTAFCCITPYIRFKDVQVAGE